MPTADLYGVTASLRKLVQLNLWRIARQTVDVGDLPPEKADAAGVNSLNLHLFHAEEDLSRRNEFPRDAMGPRPIAQAPLSLVLYYALTAHSRDPESPDVAGQQVLMGLAMKTFHDFPEIDERLELPGPPLGTAQPVLDARLRGGHNRIRIKPRQVTPEESINFWSVAQNHTARLTAYYEVRSTLLVPDDAEQQTGIVLGVGLGVGVGGRPRLDVSSSVQTVMLPTSLGGGPVVTTLTPAVAALGSVATPSGAEVTVRGRDLGDGSAAETLLLSGPDGEVEIDPVANPAWEVLLTGDQLRFVVQPSVSAVVAGAISAVPVRPGIHSIAVRRRIRGTVSDGATRSFVTTSNRLPLAIGTAVAGVSTLGGPPRLRIDLPPGVDAALAAATADLSVGGEVYALQRHDPSTPPPPLVAGEFRAVSSARLEALLTFDPADGVTRLVRLGIGGVDCAPFWIAA
jgi:hypothetical protein